MIQETGGPQRRKRLLTLGGCNLIEVGKKLAGIYDQTHLWNATWLSLASDPFDLVAKPQGEMFDRLQGFIRRETTKSDARHIAETDYDIILISAQMTHHTFVARGDRTMMDFTSPEVLTADRLGQHKRPRIQDFAGPDAIILTWRSPDFLARQTAAFETLYSRLLQPAMARGTKVVVYDQVLCDTELTPQGKFRPIGDETLKARIALNARIRAVAAAKPGIAILSTSPAFNFTAADAPWSPSEYHPVEEQYVELAIDLARLGGDEMGQQISRAHALEMRRQALAALQARQDLQEDVDRYKTRSDCFEQQSWWRETRAKSAEIELAATRQSVSWRVTTPIRVARRLLARGRKAPKAP